MNKLIFDIETLGHNFDNLDPVIQENFLKNKETPARNTTPARKAALNAAGGHSVAGGEKEKEDVMSRTGLWPVSGEIVAIAMLNPETNQGKVYFQANKDVEDYEKDGMQYKIKTEKEMLGSWWQDVKHYDQIISFNGRRFDCPFIIFRSIYHNIKATTNLMPNRYYKNNHFDIMDQLAFYGAFRNFSLEVLCTFLGIKNPKDQGVSGLAINDLFKNKEYKKIAEYCMRDVVATKELYNRIKDYIF